MRVEEVLEQPRQSRYRVAAGGDTHGQRQEDDHEDHPADAEKERVADSKHEPDDSLCDRVQSRSISHGCHPGHDAPVMSPTQVSFTDARGPGPIASEGKSGAAALASGPIYEAGPKGPGEFRDSRRPIHRVRHGPRPQGPRRLSEAPSDRRRRSHPDVNPRRRPPRPAHPSTPTAAPAPDSREDAGQVPAAMDEQDDRDDDVDRREDEPTGPRSGPPTVLRDGSDRADRRPPARRSGRPRIPTRYRCP